MSILMAGAGFCGLVLALAAFSMFALLRVRFLVVAVQREAREANRARDSALEALDTRLNALAARIEEVRMVPHGSTLASEKGGINLSRRSQALRLHRRGEPPNEIAAALGIPVQEVHLLIKVHEIVMSTV